MPFEGRPRILGAAAVSLFLSLFLLNMAAYSGTANRSPEDQLISISVNNEPLGRLLEKIGSETGIAFSLDAEWESVPISVTLYRTPLEKGLKRILANLNNVVIYGDDEVKIIILGKIEPAKGASGPPSFQSIPDYRQPEPEPEPVPEPEPEPELEPEPEPEAAEETETDKNQEPENQGETTEADTTGADGDDKAVGAAADVKNETPGEEAPETPEKPTE